MNRGIYATASGMMNSEQWLSVVSNNLANVNTTGFKRDGMSFKEAMETQLAADGGQGQGLGSIGLGVAPGVQYTSAEQGPFIRTDGGLDAAIKGSSAMFAVQTAQGVQFTRAGSFTRSADGTLVTQAGDPVLDANQRPIVLPAGQASLHPDGSISVTSPKGEVNAGQVGLFTGSFSKFGNSNYTGTNVTTADLGTTIEPGFIEGSNVNAIESMVQLIAIGRSYELQQKSIGQQDELTQKLISSMG